MPGLTKNSPIQLKLERENFNALIGRHSQPIRWLVSTKCPCIIETKKVDPNCPLCNGNSVLYEVETESIRLETLKAPIDGVIAQDNVISVRDPNGNELTIIEADCVAYVEGVKKNFEYKVTYKEDVKKSGTGIAEYIDDKLYRIDLPVNVEFGTVQGDLLSVSASVAGTPLTVTNLFRNCFEISDTILPTDQVDVTYEYVDPFKFALINNNFAKQDRKYIEDVAGDGMLTFPQRWRIFESDIIVALNSTLTRKEIIQTTGTIDSLPNFYIKEVLSAYTIRNSERVDFTPGVDFVLYKNNDIKWINPPNAGEQISFSYYYNSVYRVLGDMPNPRTSEDNRFPRKVALKLVAGFNEREGF